MLITNYKTDELVDMSETELRELLSDTPTNKQELREIIYRLVNSNKAWKKAYSYEVEERKVLEKRLEEIEEGVKKALNI